MRRFINDRIERSICNSARSSSVSLSDDLHRVSLSPRTVKSKRADRSYLAAGSKRPGWIWNELPGQRNNDGLSTLATVRHCSLLRPPWTAFWSNTQNRGDKTDDHDPLRKLSRIDLASLWFCLCNCRVGSKQVWVILWDAVIRNLGPPTHFAHQLHLGFQIFVL